MQPTSKLSPTAVFKRIRSYCASQYDVPQFINELKSLLVEDFASTFSLVKNRKLITQWKSLPTTSFVCSELRNWLLSAPLSGKRKAQFRSHLGVCEFIQAVFDEIDADAQKLGIWSSEPDAFLRAILGFVEYQSTAIDEKIPELDSGSSPQSLDAADKNVLRLRLSHDLIRDVSDGACIILAQFALRHLGACTGAPNEKEIREAFELAKRKDLIQQFFDNYSYLGWQAKIFGHTISFKAPHPDQLLLDYYRQQLITAGDQFDSVSEIALRMRLRRDKQHATPTDFDGMPFAEFLECPDGKKILNNGEKVATELTKKIRKRILEVFEETAKLHSSEGCYTIRELVDTWGFLSSLAYCAEQWTRSMIRRSRAEAFRTYAPIVKKDTLITLLSARLTISN